LKEVGARAERGRGTGTGVGAAKPPKFDGTTCTSWAVFRRQFEAVAEHNFWTHQEKFAYSITAF
jgi:hypothetical protein